MSETPKNGGPAFPVPNDANVNDQPGMSLRDWFAGQALMGLCANDVERKSGWQESLVWDAFSLANAALAHREKGDGHHD